MGEAVTSIGSATTEVGTDEYRDFAEKVPINIIYCNMNFDHT